MKRILALCAAAALVLPGCVEVDNSLGAGLIDKSLLYETNTIQFPLTEIQMKYSDALSGYSSSKLTIGAVRDELLGLTTREAAFTLIPALDTIDLGTNPKAVSFTLRFEGDSVSCNDDAQARIIQNIHVTELTKRLPAKTNTGCTQDIPHGTALLTDGMPVYNGSGDLSFSFTRAYAQKYVDALKKLGPALAERDDEKEDALNKYEDWVNELPGIHITTDLPQGNGGRINLFNFSCLSVSSNYYVRNNNIGLLTVHSTWNSVEKDSTFLFIPGEPDFYQENDYLTNNTKFDQYCFNRTTHSTTPGKAGDRILVEGGGGLKPVILASELQEKTRAEIAKAGGDPDNVIIVKATIQLPFEMPANYEDMKYFPTVLSPTISVENKDEETGETYISFAGLTDASVSTENQGSIDRSNLMFCPDITYHMQEMMDRTDLATKSDADVWLLTIHTEKVANASGSLYDNAYYQQLLYASYYNSLYGGGYGYGGYGYGSSYGYSNYYNYMMLAQMMSASTQQSYSYTTELDKDRFYRAILCGPGATSRQPKFVVTYAMRNK